MESSPERAPVALRHDLAACALLILVSMVAFHDVVTGAGNFYLRDLARFYYPAKQIVREVALSGEFPYWNRYVAAGQPLAANPEHEVFYPPTWLVLLPSYDFGYRLEILLHLWIGLAGMYALLRSMALRPPAAFFGALSWGLGGVVMSYVNLLPILFSAAWLPLTCLFARRLLARPNGRDFAWCAFFFGLQCLVGEPTTLLQTGMLLGLYAIHRGWRAGPRRLAAITTNLARIAAVSIGALLLGAVQILPAMGHVRDSVRSEPFPFELATLWSMPWAKLLELLYPHPLGHVYAYWGAVLYPGRDRAFLLGIYPGLLVAILALGAVAARLRGSGFAAFVLLLSTTLAAGNHLPLARWMHDAGIASSIRYPEKFILTGVFALVILASRMLQRILDGDERATRAARGAAIVVLAVTTVLTVIALSSRYPRIMDSLWRRETPYALIRLSRADWLAAWLRSAIAVALFAAAATTRRRLWMGAALAFLLFDLVPVAEEFNPRMPRHYFEPPPIAATLPANRGDYRLFHETDWYRGPSARLFPPAVVADYARYFAPGPASYWVVRNGLFPLTTAGSRLSTVMETDYDETELLPTRNFLYSVWQIRQAGRPDWDVPLMAMSNAWYRTRFRPFAAEVARVRGKAEDVVPVDLVPAQRWPRYYFAGEIVTIARRTDFVTRLARERHPLSAAFVALPAWTPAGGRVLSVRETANTARLDVESGGRAFLVMSVTPHRYWTVTIDGRQAQPVVTNLGYQGVEVPAGRHQIAMRYRNPLVARGGLVSAVAALGLVAIGWRRRAR